MKLLSLLLSVTLLGAVPTASMAKTPTTDVAQAVAPLNAFFKAYPAAHGTFTQTVTDAQGKATGPKSTGTFAFARPGRFIWKTTSPDNQTIVTNGQTLWIYEEDLDQVIVRPMGNELSASPAAILFGADNWSDLWTIKEAGPNTYELRPKTESQYDTLWVTLGKSGIERLVLKDAFSQTITIHFPRFEKGAGSDANFDFQMPEGVEVLTAP